MVLTQEETRAVFAVLTGTPGLMLELLYGSGMRLDELINLRVKDIDLDVRSISIRSGKGDKDRLRGDPTCRLHLLARRLVPNEELRRCLEYLETHRNRMRYGYYRKQKMTIGSAAIESVHKWVIQARCKQAGMAWSQRGLNAMLRLRCVWAFGHWDDVFSDDLRQEAENVNDFARAA